MATRCDEKACPYFAVSGETKCLQHKHWAVPKNSSFDADGYAFVSVSEIPSNARFNEIAGNLFAAVKACQDGHALKVNLKKIGRNNLTTAKRYARQAKILIGLRFIGETGYLWKMTPEQIKRAQERGERVKTARAKKSAKSKASHA
jgi:hypothetical protein